MNTLLIFIGFVVSIVMAKFRCVPVSDSYYSIVDCDRCIPEYSNEEHLPTYSLYIIGFIMILMLIIIICLAVLLYRTRMQEYKIFPPPHQLQPVATNPDLNRTYMTQNSQEMSILKMNSLPELNQTEQVQERYVEGNHNNLTTTASSKDLNRSTINRHTGLGKDFKVYRSVKKSTDQLILKEQMKKICEDALARSNISGISASLKDLNKLIQENNELNSEAVTETKEKSSSYSQLDVYDNVPSNIPVHEMAEEAVYDCLPSSLSKNIIVEDFDSKYLLALSKENLTEPAYINAQYRNNKF